MRKPIKVHEVASMTHSGSKMVAGHKFTCVLSTESPQSAMRSAEGWRKKGWAVRLYKVDNAAMRRAGDNPEYLRFVRMIHRKGR